MIEEPLGVCVLVLAAVALRLAAVSAKRAEGSSMLQGQLKPTVRTRGVGRVFGAAWRYHF